MQPNMEFFFLQKENRCKSCARDSRREWRISSACNAAAEDSLREIEDSMKLMEKC